MRPNTRQPLPPREGDKSRTILAVLLVVVSATSCAHVDTTGDPRTMTFPPPAFSPPVPSRHEFGNGLVVFLLEDHELPLVNGRALIRAGGVWDPPGKTGLARLTGSLLVQGGTERLPGGRLDEVLEDRAVEMSGEIGSQSGSVSFSSPAGELDGALTLFADVLRRPAFDQSRLEQVRGRQAEGIRRLVDDPDDLAFREYRRLLYGPDPRGRAATVEEVMALGREDVAELHRRFFHPDRVILGFSGDFDTATLVGSLERLLGDWPASGEPAPPMPVPDPAASSRALSLVDKDLPQATMVSGHLAPPKTDPDFVPFSLADYILGSGGFNSRLTREIRSNRGLAYSAGSFYRGDIGYGVFGAVVKTGNGTAAEGLGLMNAEIEGMKQGGVTPEEVAWARDSILNAMVFRYASSAAIVGESMGLAYEGLPPDFTRAFAERVGRTTREEVGRAAARWLSPERATTVVLGKTSDMTGEWPAGMPVVRLRLGPDGRTVPVGGSPIAPASP